MNGIIINGLHSYDDLGLVLKSKKIPFPTPKTDIVDIPGADGSLDMSTVLTNGDMKYKNRPCQFTFSVIDPVKNWESVKSKLANLFHGRKVSIILDADKSFYYVGRCNLDGWSEDKRIGQITLELDAEPYKYDVLESTDNWKWDIFSFESGIIYHLSNLTVNNNLTVTIPSRRMQVVPTFICSSAMQLTFNGVMYALPSGESKNLNILLVEGENVLTFAGTGTVSIKFRGGSL